MSPDGEVLSFGIFIMKPKIRVILHFFLFSPSYHLTLSPVQVRTAHQTQKNFRTHNYLVLPTKWGTLAAVNKP